MSSLRTLSLSILLAATTFALCDCATEAPVIAPNKEDGKNTPTPLTPAPTSDANGADLTLAPGDDSVGTIKTQTEGEPTISKIVTFGLGDGSFPTYLAHTLGSTAANSVIQNVTIENPSSVVKTIVLRASLAGYTKKESVATITLQPGEEKSGKFDVTLDFEALGKIMTPVSAAVDVQLESQDGKILFAAQKPTTIHSKNTVFWTNVFPEGTTPGLVEKEVVSAVFTTPRDGWGEVDKLLKQAAPYSTTKAMWGYGGYYKASNTQQQNVDGANDMLGAIWSALKARGFNYTSVSQSFFAGGQTVRYPAETLRASTGNCIDGTLVFASALEAIGMDPVFIYGPGHVFIGVKIAPGSDGVVVLETTMLGGSADYAAAANAALATLNKWSAANVATIISLAETRKKNWLPAPYPM